MDFKKRIIEELEMTDIQADTLYKGYVQVAEKLAKEYHTEQLRIGVVVSSKRFKEQDLINGYQAGAIEQKGINPDIINLEYLKKLQAESDKWLKRYTE